MQNLVKAWAFAQKILTQIFLLREMVTHDLTPAIAAARAPEFPPTCCDLRRGCASRVKTVAQLDRCHASACPSGPHRRRA
ncbi:hypothetical protein [Bradyrhizobium sp. NAS96.2]|uniref:hypothetical protein n=1 Tax=Bradyrhizobium sp. NAS96.2 TaxID=1680160 RepID=UPI0011610017|nr:hypothetical protein [Bradyrhizobium sp. NAS96.2]